MKRFLAVLALFGVVGLSAAPAFADDKPAAPVAAAAEAAPAPAAAPVAAPAPAAEAAAAEIPAPKVDKGDTTWLMVCAALVILMSIPGLALFYGGLVRSKNMLSVLMQVFMVFSLITVLWCIYGYSVAFTEGSAFFGSLDKLFLSGVTPESLAATFSKGVAVPEFAYIVFQGAFAAITCGLIIGAFAERIKFSALLVFVVLWFSFSYLPMAHMVWYWAGPDGYVDAAAAEKLGATAGFLFQKGALDFAGGTVVHINAAVAGLVGAFLIGKRIGYGRESMAPHSLTMTMIGASLLWFGWFGFNAGSALSAGDLAASAFVTTHLAAAAASLSWIFAEWMHRGKPTTLGLASGAVAGLVAITPAAGFVTPMASIIIGLVGGLVCYLGVNMKHIFKYDDALDVVGVHGLGGTWGALATGLFATKAVNEVGNDGLLYGNPGLLWSQFISVVATWVFCFVGTLVILYIVNAIIKVRVNEEDENKGLDVSQHGETGYQN